MSKTCWQDSVTNLDDDDNDDGETNSFRNCGNACNQNKITLSRKRVSLLWQMCNMKKFLPEYKDKELDLLAVYNPL